MYSKHSTAYELSGLFLILRNYSENTVAEFFDDFFAVKNQTIGVFLKENPPLGNVHLFKSILLSLSAVDAQLEERFLAQFTDLNLQRLLYQSNFPSIGQSLSSLSKALKTVLVTRLLIINTSYDMATKSHSG